MGRQSEIFRKSEAKAWLSRNEHKLPLERDPVVAALRDQEIPYHSVLEVGCANGWRLYEIQDTTPDKTVNACGIDPCIETEITDANLRIVQGTAENIPFLDGAFDLVIYGFCLYVCDPSDHFRIAMEGDRVLAAGGHICIFDFNVGEPYSNIYEHSPGVYSYKMDFSRLWTWSPLYQTVSHIRFGSGDERMAVSIIQKRPSSAFPVRVR